MNTNVDERVDGDDFDDSDESHSGVFFVDSIGLGSPASSELDAPASESPSSEERTVDVPVFAPLPRSMSGLIGQSAALVDVFRVVDRVAKTMCTVLVTGESGTGKELVARALHAASDRASGPFIAVNCGAIPEALLESELFGHAKGSFTGAHATKSGRIAMAQGGTLFLDEIGELPLSLQVKLLRVLQSKEYSPVGDTRTLTADVRIVAATNVDLEVAVQNGLFREDLFYRLNVIHIPVPPLRERLDDIPLLVQYFLMRAREKTGREDVAGISRAAAELLMAWHWPGNVRELENTIERAVLMCAETTIEPRDLPARVCGLGTERRVAPRLPDSGIDLRGAVESFENQLIRQALERTNWNKKQAAVLLGLNRTTLVEMLKRKRINPKAA
ncbi:MAG TPA: sigma 54-interacting transcriptional regulator [Polyangiaceae bacterium]|jgi:transcriptional regulator with PAS, ATPase and Fis domain|nr:sigma 54-interacting transcriptional regulator [Polyangiaceae bacterium]